jgi:hypothetical protein
LAPVEVEHFNQKSLTLNFLEDGLDAVVDEVALSNLLHELSAI